MSELKYWLWLSALQGLGPRTKTRLLERYESPREIFFAPHGEFSGVKGITKAECAALEDRSLDAAMTIMDLCAEKDIGILTLQDTQYPARLRNIFDPPAVLYVRGRLPAVDEEAAIAVIGTRKATPYGLKMGRSMGYEITKCGGLVVSGLTEGVDASGAVGALAAQGACIGVLATPIDGDYGGAIARDVAAVGALVSEYPPGSRTLPSHFRDRNRVTAGLSVGVVVVEAPAKSGALMFAAEALDQGKEIFVVPANADAEAAKGSNALMQDGAKPVFIGWDVLCEFQSRFPDRVRESGKGEKMAPGMEKQGQNPPQTEKKSGGLGEGFVKLRQPQSKKGIDKQNTVEYIDLQKQLERLSETQLKIVSVMDASAVHVDDIIERSGLDAACVLSELTMLQLLGCVRQESGKRFALNIIQK